MKLKYRNMTCFFKLLKKNRIVFRQLGNQTDVVQFWIIPSLTYTPTWKNEAQHSTLLCWNISIVKTGHSWVGQVYENLSCFVHGRLLSLFVTLLRKPYLLQVELFALFQIFAMVLSLPYLKGNKKNKNKYFIEINTIIVSSISTLFF